MGRSESGSSLSFNSFPATGRVRCGALLPWLWHCSPQRELPREGVQDPSGATPSRAGLDSRHHEGGSTVEFPSPMHTARANKGPGKENCDAMLRAPNPAPCPGARISAGRGNDLSSLIHSLLQDQTWPAGRSPGLGGVGGARAGPAGSGCPLGARMLSGTPGRGGMLFGEGCFSGGMLLEEKSCTSPTHPSPGSVPDPGRGPPAVRVLAPGAGGGQSPGPGSPSRGGPALPPLPSPPPGPCRSRHSEPSRAEPSQAVLRCRRRAGTMRTG